MSKNVNQRYVNFLAISIFFTFFEMLRSYFDSHRQIMLNTWLNYLYIF